MQVNRQRESKVSVETVVVVDPENDWFGAIAIGQVDCEMYRTAFAPVTSATDLKTFHCPAPPLPGCSPTSRRYIL